MVFGEEDLGYSTVPLLLVNLRYGKLLVGKCTEVRRKRKVLIVAYMRAFSFWRNNNTHITYSYLELNHLAIMTRH